MTDSVSKKILIIQTAFIGDVILATPLLEYFHKNYPEKELYFLLRKGNEGLFNNHPYLKRVFVWDKSRKYKNMRSLAKEINQIGPFEKIYNLQRFASSGMFAKLIKAEEKIGFSKNPLSIFYSRRVKHKIGEGHEVERNLKLIGDASLKTSDYPVRLYPEEPGESIFRELKQSDFVTISPASVWHTKQLQREKWIELIEQLPEEIKIVLLGGKGDRDLCDSIRNRFERKIINLAGKTNFLDTAWIMKWAILNYSNDSAPMHLSSSQNAPVCAVYCSTVPEFGFGPLSDFSRIVQVEDLKCKPCGLHGHKSCPKGHFKCSVNLDIKKLLNAYHEALNFRRNNK